VAAHGYGPTDFRHSGIALGRYCRRLSGHQAEERGQAEAIGPLDDSCLALGVPMWR